MKIDRDLILTLIIAQNTGKATEQEISDLEQLIATDEEAKKLYDDFHSVISRPEFVADRHALPSLAPFNKVFEVPAVRTRRFPARIIAGMAAMLLVLLSIYPVIQWLKTEPRQLAVTKSIGVELIIDGKAISLDKADSAINISSIALNNSNNTLTYSAGTAAATRENGLITVPAGRFYNIILSDGTKVMLNATTKLQFPFNFNGKREIWIDGEAFLDVKKDTKKPFIVHLPHSTIQVLGTSFNVNTYDHREKVSLVTGKVRMVKGSDSVTLQPGKEANSSFDNAITMAGFDQEEVLGWKDGIYVFRDNTLEEVANVIGRWYGMKLILKGEAKDRRYIGAVNRNEPIEDFLENIHQANGLTYSVDSINKTVVVK